MTKGQVPQHNAQKRLEFSWRLNKALDANGYPPLHHGRLLEFRNDVRKACRDTTSTEAVRKWLNGLSIPKSTRVDQLAKMLKVNARWLMFGQGSMRDDASSSPADPIEIRISETITTLTQGQKEAVAHLVEMMNDKIDELTRTKIEPIRKSMRYRAKKAEAKKA